MGSTLRNDTRKALFLERLARAWDKRPDLHFGELLRNALASGPPLLLHERTDTEIVEAVERYVLIGPTGAPPTFPPTGDKSGE